MLVFLSVLFLNTAFASVTTPVNDTTVPPDKAGSRQILPDEQRLLTKLMRNYDNAVRPVINASQNIVVGFGFTLIQIMDMDERNQAVVTNVWLEHEWHDERLRWNPANYNNLRILRVPARKLWLPDIVLYNNADDFTAGYMLVNAMVHSTGQVFWAPPARLRSSCKVDITYFPFDDQTCGLKFGSWAYDKDQVDIVNKTAALDIGNYVTNGEWKFIGSKVVRNEVVYPISPAIYPDVTVSFIIRRRILYYVINIIVPCVWLNFLSLLSFRLPPDAGEKITLGITVLLSYSVFTLLVAESMPATSEFLPLIGIYLTISMALTSISVVFTVWVLTIHHCSPSQTQVPSWMRAFVVGWFARFFSCQCCSKKKRIFAKRQLRVGNCSSSGGGDQRSFKASLQTSDNAAAEACLRLISDVEMKNHMRCNCNGGNGRTSTATSTRNGDVAIEFSDIHASSMTDFSKGAARSGSPYTAVSETANMTDVRKLAVMEEIARNLRIIIAKREEEERRLEIANEWRQVAHVVDNILFWIFFFTTVIITIIMMVVVPIVREY